MAATRTRLIAALTLASLLTIAACTGDSSSSSDTSLRPLATTSVADSDLPGAMKAIMSKPRYREATWSLLVTDVETDESYYALNADRVSLTGSTRKLFSVGTALNALGADARQLTPVHRQGTVDGGGRLDGDLILVAGGDLTFGGRRVDADTIAVTNVDHNDANILGSAQLTPQDPLFALDQLAAEVRASGITSVSGDVVVDDRLFDAYRVPNGDLLVTPMMVNENHVDVTVTPTRRGEPAIIDHRPRTGGFTVDGEVETTAAGSETSVVFSDTNLIECLGEVGCSGSVDGEIAANFEGPLTGLPAFVGTFRVEDPLSFARTAFIEALARQGVAVAAPPVAPNPGRVLPESLDYGTDTQVATYRSPPFSQNAALVLKVSLNLGANLDLSLFGVTEGERTIDGALAAERQALIGDYGLDPDQFDFPTNGGGTPDSRAAPRALVQFLLEMSQTPVSGAFQSALPVLGVDGSLSDTGSTLPGRGFVTAKPGTVIDPAPDDEGLVLVAQNLAGYIETASGRKVAYALMVNDAGPVNDLTADVGQVLEDEAAISSLIYELL